MSSNGNTEQSFVRPPAILSPGIENDTKAVARDTASWARAQSLPLPELAASEYPSQGLRGIVLDSQIGTPPPEPKAHAQVKDEYMGIDIIPKTPEREIGRECLGGGKRQRFPGQYLREPRTGIGKRTETIVDDTLKARRSKGIVRTVVDQSSTVMRTPPRQKGKLNQVPPERSSGKMLREFPPGAPGLVETKGKYTFRKGIRSTREYRILPPKAKVISPRSPAYQCRDGFDRHQATDRRPRTTKKVLRISKQQLEEQPVSFEPRSATSLDESPALGEWRFGGKVCTDSAPKPTSTAPAETNFPDNKPPVIKQEHDNGFEVWFAEGIEDNAADLVGSIETD